MTIYQCDICKIHFDRKSTYNKHLSRINPCKLNINNDNECTYCNKKFSKLSNLNKHLKICKKKIIDDNNKNEIEELKKMFQDKFEEQQKKINELMNNKNNNITINDNSTTLNDNSTTLNDNSTTNIINIYSSGKEDLSLLDKEDILKLCTSGTFYPIIAAEILHCNEKYPEYQNVLISNLRASTGLVKINDKWVTKSHDELLTNMMNVDKKHISTLIKNLNVENKYRVKLESTQDEIDTNECKEHHKDKIKRKLYDASKMIAKHKKQSEISNN